MSYGAGVRDGDWTRPQGQRAMMWNAVPQLHNATIQYNSMDIVTLLAISGHCQRSGRVASQNPPGHQVSFLSDFLRGSDKMMSLMDLLILVTVKTSQFEHLKPLKLHFSNTTRPTDRNRILIHHQSTPQIIIEIQSANTEI
jgi:hypothetical protein